MELRPKTMVIGLLAVVSLVAIQGCSGGDKAASTLLPSTGGGGGGNTVSGSGFYVSVTADEEAPITTYLHKFNSFSTACEIPVSTTTPTDLQCLLNAREADLYNASTTLEINVPAGMCKYLTEQPYWYWDRAAGQGPASLEIVVTDGDITSCEADNTPGVVAGGLCTVTEGIFNDAGEFYCSYDYTPYETGPNCCIGSYMKTVTTIDTSAGTTTDTTVSVGKYGGSLGACGDGPGIQGMNWQLGTYDIPLRIWNQVSEASGLNKTMTIPAGIDINSRPRASVYAANMYGWANYVAGTHSTATLPTGMSTLVDLSGSTLSTPNSAYTFGCWDSARELKHRIRVYINEWDTDEKFEAYAASGGNTSNSPDTAATDLEGIHCNVSGSVPDGYCDDFWDWDQLTTEGYVLPEDSDNFDD